MRKRESKGPYKSYYKEQALSAAKGLGYGQEVIEAIKACDSEIEIACMMAKARHDKFDHEE